MATNTTSFTKTPQAGDDFYSYTQADLLASSLYNATTNVVTLDVMSNDLGGNAKTLFSIDDGNGNFLNDLLTNNVNTGWEYLASGNRIQIVNGKIQLDISHSLDGQGLASLAAGETISETFDYSIRLGNGTLSWAQVSFSVIGRNDMTTGSATASLAAGAEDTAYTLHASDLLTGFADVDGDTLSVAGLTASHGALHDNGNGTWTFAPDANFNGPVNLTYNVIDGNGSTIAASQSFALAAVNDAPALTGTAATLAAGSEDTAYVIHASDLLAGYSDVEGDSLSVTDLVATNGTLTATATGWSFAPDANFNGTVDLSYNVFDGTDKTAASQSFALAAVNDAPALTGTAATLAAGSEDTAYVIHANDLLAGYSDVEGDSLSVTDLVAANGTLTATATGWSFAPDANFNGTVDLGYNVFDGTDKTAASQSFALAAVNDPPTTSPVTLAAMAEDSGVRVITQAQLLANASDVDGPALTASGLAIASGSGALADNGNGTWSYTPVLDDASNVSFSYTVSDGSLTAAGSATLDITPVNDAPTDINFNAAPLPSGTTLPGAGAMLATLTTDDVDDSTGFTYSFSSGTGSGFALEASTGVLTTNAALAASTTYPLKFVSTDAGLLQSPEQTLTIITGKNTASEALNGQTGDDIIYALSSGNGSNKDVVFAGSGDDTVFGQNGVDELHGGAGNDMLTGGAGADIFFFDTALDASTNVDTITDFVSGSDTIKLENTGAGLFNALAAGALSAGVLDIVDAGPAADGSTRIIYDPSTGALSYDADGTAGGSAAVQFAVIGTTTHPLTLSNADFLVI